MPDFEPSVVRVSKIATVEAAWCERIGRLPEVVDRVKLIGGQMVASTPEVLAARVRSDIAKWRDLAQRANIRVE